MHETAERFVVHGGRMLSGGVQIRGSKNAASKAMVATLLTDEPCILENVPFSEEAAITRELCERIGSSITYGDDHTCSIVTPRIREHSVIELSRRNRIPILAFGPLLVRAGEAEVPFLGGDPIGHRPIDFHLEALARMGAVIERRERSYYATAPYLTGTDIAFPFPSVGATESVLLAGVLARGRTRIENAAIEPEVQNLIAMLIAMGALITCESDERRIEIEGVRQLRGVRHRIIPDRNEAVSFAVAGLATGGAITLRGAEPAHLASFIAVVRAMGIIVEENDHGLYIASPSSAGPMDVSSVSIATAPHPGFMTDWQQPLAVFLTRAKGTSIIHETVYEDRLGYLKDLARMGADISVSDECPSDSPCRFSGRTFNHVARITGPVSLNGADIEITDIRAGMAHIIAALSATGKSVISGVAHIDRGYETLDERLRTLGADITRV
ncbi:MAG: UDP-N-acetylglucosamine 1-carboxyvinyltransferase [Candidatus Sungbacteria bacterium RIFCSPHIGHO2_01_FULL_54_26]|nr:MAG: UDP-N-acetylglucosamine 1-carboxyvinyltransferase [Candidatus Sungbacteria bacterium RIFCSPHIGHO2_01_FULL_54_26]